MNKVTLIGRVGAPFKRNGQSAVGEFTFATTSYERARDGEEYQEVTEWHAVKVLGEQNCQAAEKHFIKGKPLYLEGRLKTEKWESQGEEREKTKIYLTYWEFLPSDPHLKPTEKKN